MSKYHSKEFLDQKKAHKLIEIQETEMKFHTLARNLKKVKNLSPPVISDFSLQELERLEKFWDLILKTAEEFINTEKL